MPEYDKETSRRLLSDYHVLILTVRPAQGQILVPSDAFHKRVEQELGAHIPELVRPYFSIWTREFFDPRSPTRNYQTEAVPNAMAVGPSFPFDSGRYLASIVLPAAFIEATPNPRGRPGRRGTGADGSSPSFRLTGVRDPIEFGIARAVAVQTYRLVRVIAGYLDAGRREVAVDRAVTLLAPYAAPLLPLTFHAEPSSRDADEPDAVLAKLIGDLCEEAPSQVADLYGTADRREMGWRWTGEGAGLAGEHRSSPLDLPLVADMLSVLDGLVQLRLEARSTADAMRRLKRTSVLQDRDARADRSIGYRVAPEITEAIGRTRHPGRLPSEDVLVRMAYELEFDPSRFVPNKAYLRPLLEAACALGAHHRRGTTDRSLLATYGLRAWSKNFDDYDHPACLSALRLVPKVPEAMKPAADDLPYVAPVDVEMTELKTSP